MDSSLINDLDVYEKEHVFLYAHLQGLRSKVTRLCGARFSVSVTITTRSKGVWYTLSFFNHAARAFTFTFMLLGRHPYPEPLKKRTYYNSGFYPIF